MQTYLADADGFFVRWISASPSTVLHSDRAGRKSITVFAQSRLVLIKEPPDCRYRSLDVFVRMR